MSNPYLMWLKYEVMVELQRNLNNSYISNKHGLRERYLKMAYLLLRIT